jgi:hypothetical protein
MVHEQESSRFAVINLSDRWRPGIEINPPSLAGFGTVLRAILTSKFECRERFIEVAFIGTGGVAIVIAKGPPFAPMRVFGRKLSADDEAGYVDVSAISPWSLTIGAKPVSIRMLDCDDMSTDAVQLSFRHEDRPLDWTVVQFDEKGLVRTLIDISFL